MAREPDRNSESSVLDRIDPFCWMLVAAVVLSTVLVVIMGLYWIAAFLVVCAVGVVAYDAWVNRPDESDRSRPSPSRATSQRTRGSDRPSDRRPAQRSRPPERRPARSR